MIGLSALRYLGAVGRTPLARAEARLVRQIAMARFRPSRRRTRNGGGAKRSSSRPTATGALQPSQRFKWTAAMSSSRRPNGRFDSWAIRGCEERNGANRAARLGRNRGLPFFFLKLGIYGRLICSSPFAPSGETRRFALSARPAVRSFPRVRGDGASGDRRPAECCGLRRSRLCLARA